jgi:ribosomal-protein-alanine N-acetyltransferase
MVKEDAESLSDLLNRLSDDAKRFFHPHSYNKDTIQQLCGSKEYYFVVVQDGMVIGYSMLRFFEYAIPSFGCCIRTGYEHRGYGQLVIEQTLEKAKMLGISQVMLHVHPSNTKAYQLYKNTGFEETGEAHNGELVMLWSKHD